MRPSDDIELTQVRRTLETLERDGHLKRRERKVGDRARGHDFRLSAAGLLALADKLVDECGPAFEDYLFVLHFAKSYRSALRAQVIAASDRVTQQLRRRLGTLLDPARIAKHAVKTYQRLVDDLRARIAADAVLETELRRFTAQQLDDEASVSALASIGAYQLERTQPLKDVLRRLPAQLRRIELESGIASRRALIFRPLLARAEIELATLEHIASMAGPLDPRRGQQLSRQKESG